MFFYFYYLFNVILLIIFDLMFLCHLYSRIVLKVQCVNIIIFLPIIVSHVPASQPAWHGLKIIDILVLLFFFFGPCNEISGVQCHLDTSPFI